MKKVSTILFLFLFGIAFKGYSQSATATATPTDFFAGKWTLSVAGTPNGDITLLTELTRTDGKLTGQLKDTSGKMADPIPITKIDEGTNKISLYFTAQGYDVNVDLDKVDDDNLKGTLMGMFDAKAVRVKN